LLKAIAGLIPRTGRVRLDGAEIDPRAKTSELVRRGIALVAEGPAALSADDGDREPRARRLARARGRARARLSAAFADFPRSPSAAASSPER
jgi:branched-chain amino acid transport system ATP-binding protein